MGEVGKRLPKDVILFLYEPGKKFAHILVELKNEPGALSDAAEKVAQVGVNVLTGFTSVDPGKEVGVWSFFADMDGGKGGVSGLKSFLGKSRFVLAVTVVESDEGLLTDSLHFPLRFSPGREVVGFNRGTIGSMFRRVISTFGSGGEVIIFEEGKEVGKEGGRFLLRVLGRNTIKGKIKKVGDLFSGWGWGIAQSIEVDGDFSEVRIRVKDCFESQGGESKEPVCHFVRGMFEGLFEEVTATHMKAREVRCLAQGNEWCEFVISEM